MNSILRKFNWLVSGGPTWLDSVHYDIEAKPDRPSHDWKLVLQALLPDRFELAFHRETKELPIYVLMLARKDGKLGPGIRESNDGDCAAPDLSKPPTAPADCRR
jgi:uncharacterized protein (TIGR03435 family)